MFSLVDDTYPVGLLGQYDPALATAAHFGLRPKGWQKIPYNINAESDLDNIAHTLALQLADQKDLQFIKLRVVWPSAEKIDRVAVFRHRTGLNEQTILRRIVKGSGASVEDWAALFRFTLAFGWDAVAVSRRTRSLIWFSHDEFLRATPPSLVRNL